MGECADGAIVGSAIVKLAAEHGRDAAGPIGEYVKKMKRRHQSINSKNSRGL